ncbi:hypothetical protein GEMRC1_009200 [Eukaryota sp. GEM-RC1]
MDKNGEKLPLITRKEVEHIQTLLRYISAEHHEIELPQGRPPTFNEQLKNFVLEEYKQVMLNNGGFTLFPAARSSRIMAMVGETIKTNLDTNIKMRYAQYIDKFINVYFQKTDQEEKMSKKEQSVFRWRLRQVTNVFLEGNRNDVPKTTVEIKQFIQR